MLANPRSVKLSHLSRRTFLAMAGQSAAIAGMAASPTVLAQADSARALVTGKYQVFERGNWLPWEREIIERRFAEAAAGPVAANDGPGGIMAGFANVGQPLWTRPILWRTTAPGRAAIGCSRTPGMRNRQAFRVCRRSRISG